MNIQKCAYSLRIPYKIYAPTLITCFVIVPEMLLNSDQEQIKGIKVMFILIMVYRTGNTSEKPFEKEKIAFEYVYHIK